MSPFEPLGEQARWRLLYDYLRTRTVGDVVTYETFGDLLGLGADDRHPIQMAVRRAAKELEQVDRHALEAVRGVGYRIVLPEEHLRLARQHQRKSNGALARGHSKVVNVDLSGVDSEVRQAFQVVAQAFAMQMDFNRRMDVRQRELETTVQTVTVQSERSAEEIAELRSRLERLEGSA